MVLLFRPWSLSIQFLIRLGIEAVDLILWQDFEDIVRQRKGFERYSSRHGGRTWMALHVIYA